MRTAILICTIGGVNKLKIRGRNLRHACLLLLKGGWFILTLPIRLIDLTQRRHTPVIHEDYLPEYAEQVYLDCPEFIQYFEINADMGIGLESIELCPEETAVFRIVGDTDISKQYRRKIYRDTGGEKYLKLNNTNYYLRNQEFTPKVQK